MLNRDGVRVTSYASTRQILADVGNQSSVGCIVPQSLGVAVGAKKIAKAGTPINIDLMNVQTPVKAVAAASGSGDTAVAATPLNAVLLHDVDVTAGKANGTALIFGFVNVAWLESDVVTAITSALEVDGASPLVVFGKWL